MSHPLFFRADSFVLNSSFPQATNQTLLDKFKRQHEGNSYIEFPAVMEPAFIIRHYAGKVKYGVKVSLTSTGSTRDMQPTQALFPTCFIM